MTRTNVYLLIFFSGLVVGCAQMAQPTGGERDITPPALSPKGDIPASNSVNFSAQRVYLEFDEYIKLQPGKQPIISPPLKTQPQLSIKGKKLQIDLPPDLQPNTTYAIYFPGMIGDITENNLIDNYTYVFSTGDLLDTGAVNGTIVNASSHAPVSKTWILLYNDTCKNPLKQSAPAAISKSVAGGNYQVNYIKKGKYKVYALSDMNNNLRYDLPGEWIGFCDSVMEVDSFVTVPVMKLFKQAESIFNVNTDISVSNTLHKIVFNRIVPEMKLSLLSKDQNLAGYEILKGDSSVFIAFRNKLTDTAWIKIEGRDLTDTFYVLPDINKAIAYKVDLPAEKNLLPDEAFIFQVNEWSTWNKNKITITDTLHKHKIETIELKDGIFPTLHFNHSPDNVYRIELLPGALSNAGTNTNDTLVFYGKWLPPEKYGLLTLNYDFTKAGSSPKYYIEILRPTPLQSDTVAVTNASGSVTFKALRPGNYVVRMFADLNGDGRWNTGNLEKGVQPEPSFHNIKPFQIRANWDMDLIWKIE